MSVPKPVWPLFPPQPLWSSVSVSAVWETLGLSSHPAFVGTLTGMFVVG